MIPTTVSSSIIENPAAVTTEAQDPTAAKAFLDFSLSDEGQQIIADYGYRPIVESVLQRNAEEFPEVPGLFTIQEFGGWSSVDEKFFDDETGSVTVKRLPSPTLLVTSMLPPIMSVRPRLIASPMPVPSISPVCTPKRSNG